MIKTPTAFVLGAGASQPYGFPTGARLRQDILGNFPEIERLAFPADPSSAPRLIQQFKSTFRRARSTIDEFLEHNPELRDTGKRLIAGHIIRHEDENSLYPRTGDWMTQLFAWMAEDCDASTFVDNKLSVVTLNYDRSFEFALHKFIEARFRVSPIEAARIMHGIPIVHVHGQIGVLLDETGRTVSEYRPELADGMRWYEDVRIIHDPTQDEVLKEAIALLQHTSRIFCLGFGYHRVNMERLFGSHIARGVSIYGTCKDLFPAECRSIWRRFPDRSKSNDFDSPSCRIGLAEPTVDCLDCLRHYADIFTR